MLLKDAKDIMDITKNKHKSDARDGQGIGSNQKYQNTKITIPGRYNERKTIQREISLVEKLMGLV